jgi:Zn-dependent peptidase ImmA (M78 family)
MATIERGFKSWCERASLAVRAELGLEPHAPLPARRFADHLDVSLITPSDIKDLPANVLNQLTVVDPSGWSALSIIVARKITIIYNPGNSLGRQSSDVMHELAHVVLEHEPSQLILSMQGDLAMRSFNAKQEDEANWLGWTLLLPKEALQHCVAQKKPISQIATEYCVSEPLVTFRRRMTGVDLQAKRRRRAAK